MNVRGCIVVTERHSRQREPESQATGTGVSLNRKLRVQGQMFEPWSVSFGGKNTHGQLAEGNDHLSEPQNGKVIQSERV